MNDERSIREIRLGKLERLREIGLDPYAVERWETGPAQQLLDTFEEGRQVSFAGRIVSYRLMGKAGFAHLSDGDSKIQAYFRKDDLTESEWEAFNLLDLGDHLGIQGELFTTRTLEPSIHVRHMHPLSKSLQVLPLGKEKDGHQWYGLADVEQRYRHRHLDLIANAEARRTLVLRSKLVSAVRHYFDSCGYVEVETPLLQTIAGGAAAKPFTTHYNAYEMEVKLRISLELYLKRLICGDLPKVYEIGRVFRNEGVSNRHNPEFSLLEFYEAYANLEDMMRRVEKLFEFAASEVFKTTKFFPFLNPADLKSPMAPQISPIELAFLGSSDHSLQFVMFEPSGELIASEEPETVAAGGTLEHEDWNAPLTVVAGTIDAFAGTQHTIIQVHEGGAELAFSGHTESFAHGSYHVRIGTRPLKDERDLRRFWGFDFSLPWKRVNLMEEIKGHTGMTDEELSDLDAAKRAIVARGVDKKAIAAGGFINLEKENSLGGLIEKLLELFVEPTLQEPTFVIGYPIETSPLAKKDPKNPRMTRRFEGYILGREMCNAFSEINDPVDQLERFENQQQQMDGGNDEAHPMDKEFIFALEGGMPPTGGCGIGMERLAMALTGADHIREVILFPMMKPERPVGESDQN